MSGKQASLVELVPNPTELSEKCDDYTLLILKISVASNGPSRKR